MKAIGLTLLSSLLYVFGYALSKLLVGSYGLSAPQVTFLRCAIVLTAAVFALPFPRSGVSVRRILNPARAWEQRAAAVSLVASNALAVAAYGLMSVTSASALSFLTPMILVGLSGVVLHERVPLVRWVAVVAGFAGVLLIVRPGDGTAPWGIAAGVAGALTYAVYQVLIRRLRAAATSLDTAIQVSLAGVVLLAGAMGVFWRDLSLQGFGVMVLCTAVQTAALACIAAALRRGEASRVAPWQYSGLIWAMVMDAVAFGTAVPLPALLGAGLIVGGGVLAQAGGGRRDGGRAGGRGAD